MIRDEQADRQTRKEQSCTSAVVHAQRPFALAAGAAGKDASKYTASCLPAACVCMLNAACPLPLTFLFPLPFFTTMHLACEREKSIQQASSTNSNSQRYQQNQQVPPSKIALCHQQRHPPWSPQSRRPPPPLSAPLTSGLFPKRLWADWRAVFLLLFCFFSFGRRRAPFLLQG